MSFCARWLLLAILPPSIVVGSFFVDWRFACIAGYLVFALGGLVALANFYLAAIRRDDRRHVSGIPLLGVLNVVGLVLAPRSVALSVSALVLLALDTGSISWFVASVWRDPSFWGR